MDQYDAYVRDRRHNLWDKLWKNREGRVVLWQMPNVWLIGWAAGTTLSLFFGGHTGDVFFWIASASLVIWSILEIIWGANYFRRALGLVVLIYAVASMLKSL